MSQNLSSSVECNGHILCLVQPSVELQASVHSFNKQYAVFVGFVAVATLNHFLVYKTYTNIYTQPEHDGLIQLVAATMNQYPSGEGPLTFSYMTHA